MPNARYAETWVYKFQMCIALLYTCAAIACIALATQSDCKNIVKLQTIKNNATFTLRTAPFDVGFFFITSLILSACFAFFFAKTAPSHCKDTRNTLFYNIAIAAPLTYIGIIVGIAEIVDLWAVLAVACTSALSVIVIFHKHHETWHTILVGIVHVAISIALFTTADMSAVPLLMIVSASFAIVVPLFLAADTHVFKNKRDTHLRTIVRQSGLSLYVQFTCSIMWAAHCARVQNNSVIVTAALVTLVVFGIGYAIGIKTIPVKKQTSYKTLSAINENDNDCTPSDDHANLTTQSVFVIQQDNADCNEEIIEEGSHTVL